MRRMPLGAPGEPQPREAPGAAGGAGGFGIPAGTAPIGPGAAGTSLCQRWGHQDRSGTCPLCQGKAPEPGFGPGWFLHAGIPSPEPRLAFGCSLLSAAGNGTAVPPAPPKSRGFTAFGTILLAQGISRGTGGDKQHLLQPEATIPSFSGLL
ncbi:hypothetical protein DV515_00013089 [Chloebia gouldiae]|uniref:Uncharacterized protein n=1 Tax=Chloebia gouldiae TaxID=44316 RepID=A0A3L8S211_CHLGU|nr:hypothetical protein DV515_00013089 [Chloebia gouldiae]